MTETAELRLLHWPPTNSRLIVLLLLLSAAEDQPYSTVAPASLDCDQISVSQKGLHKLITNKCRCKSPHIVLMVGVSHLCPSQQCQNVLKYWYKIDA